MLSLKNLLSVAALTLSVSAFSQTIQLGQPSTGGNGCPQGTASAAVSPDGQAVSILFDQFIAEAGPNVGKTLDRKSCNIQIPVYVPGGFSVSVVSIDYRGFVGLPRGANARLTAEYFFAGMMGPRYAKDFYGAQNTDYIFNNMIGVQANVWSPCGASTILRVNAGMMLQNRGYEDAMATVDSADISAGMVYHLQYRRCM